MIYLLNAYLTDDSTFLGQQKVVKKSNEITAMPKLLEVLDLEGALVSIDAMGCQKDIAKQIVDQKGNYLLAVKKNQKTLYHDIKIAFCVQKPEEATMFKTEEINGSRIETRICKTITDTSHIEKINDWKNLKTIITIYTETYNKSAQNTSKHTRYYISNEVNTAEYFLKATRNHWAIENNLHWSLDVILKEDQSRKRFKNVTENYSIILKTVLKLLQDKQKINKKISIKRMRKKAAWDLEYLLELLNF